MDGEHNTETEAGCLVQRIPLDIVVTTTGERTPGVIVAVMASDLDALEAEVTALRQQIAEGGESAPQPPAEGDRNHTVDSARTTDAG